MKSIVFYLWVSLLLLLSGFFLGEIWNPKQINIQIEDVQITSMATVLSATFTIVIAVISYNALSSWKNQHIYNAQFNATIELEKCYRKLHIALLNLFEEWGSMSETDTVYNLSNYRKIKLLLQAYGLAYTHMISLNNKVFEVEYIDDVSTYFRIRTLVHLLEINKNTEYHSFLRKYKNDTISKIRKFRP